MTRRVRAALVCVLFPVAVIAVVSQVRARHPIPAVVVSAHSAAIDTTLARDDAGCAGVRSTVWHPLSGVDYTGRLRVRLPAQIGGSVVFYIGDSVPLDLEAETPDGRPITLHLERLPPGPGLHVPPDFWLDDNAPWSAPREIARVAIDALGHRDLPFTLSLGRRAPRVLARLFGYPPETHVAVCADQVGANDPYFATGWYGQESTSDGVVRWMREHGAVLLASATGQAAHVHLRAAAAVPSSDGDKTTLSLRVNDAFDAPPRLMLGGFADYDWDVPDSAWVAGTNELFFSVSRTLTRGTRTLGLALSSVTAR
jgi:hypothetical protein